MTHGHLRNDFIPLATLQKAVTRSHEDITKRQQKHDMLITFMSNVKTPKQTRRPAPIKPKLLKTLLSFFL